MPLLVAIAIAAAQAVADAAYIERDFVAGRQRPVTVSHAPVAERPAHPDGEPLALPTAPPALPVRGSTMSPLLRARDVFDVSRFPARAAAKLFQLDAAGKRTGTACTAQFVAARFLLTAGHCLVSPTTGEFHGGFEVAAGWDAGTAAAGIAAVVHGWVPAELTQPRGGSPLVTPDNCHDLALIEIARPLGETTGWLGLADRTPGADAVLYRFSYPQQTDLKTLTDMRDKPGQPEQVRRALDAMIGQARVRDPDFSPDNLYLEYGRVNRAEGRFVAERGGYNLPGRSGAALIDGEGRIVALLSRGYAGEVFSCRVTSGDIGAVAALTRS